VGFSLSVYRRLVVPEKRRAIVPRIAFKYTLRGKRFNQQKMSSGIDFSNKVSSMSVDELTEVVNQMSNWQPEYVDAVKNELRKRGAYDDAIHLSITSQMEKEEKYYLEGEKIDGWILGLQFFLCLAMLKTGLWIITPVTLMIFVFFSFRQQKTPMGKTVPRYKTNDRYALGAGVILSIVFFALHILFSGGAY
jgi:hypothetical protein